MATYATGNPEVNAIIRNGQKVSGDFFRREHVKIEATLRKGLEKYGIVGKAQDAILSHIICDGLNPDWMNLDEAIEAGKIRFSTSEKEQACRRAYSWYQSEIERIILESNALEDEVINKGYEAKGWL